MKKLILLLTLFSCLGVAKAQDAAAADSAVTLVSISSYLRSTGRVAIYPDQRLESLISFHPKAYYLNYRKGKNGDYIVSTGYRIRAFSGNNQLQSKNRAYKIESELKEYYPDLATYVIFKSPNWRLLLGNFTTNEEAVSMLRELKKKFPEYGREMFVIKDEIEISR